VDVTLARLAPRCPGLQRAYTVGAASARGRRLIRPPESALVEIALRLDHRAREVSRGGRADGGDTVAPAPPALSRLLPRTNCASPPTATALNGASSAARAPSPAANPEDKARPLHRPLPASWRPSLHADRSCPLRTMRSASRCWSLPPVPLSRARQPRNVESSTVSAPCGPPLCRRRAGAVRQSLPECVGINRSSIKDEAFGPGSPPPGLPAFALGTPACVTVASGGGPRGTIAADRWPASPLSRSRRVSYP